MKFMVQPRINGIPMALFVAAIVLLTAAQLSAASPMIPNYFDYDMHQKQNMPAPEYTKAGIQSTIEYLQNALNALNLEKFSTSKRSRLFDGGIQRDISGKTVAEFELIKQLISNPNQSSPSTKRGIDLGLGRGFSGSQAAKHLMGLAAANFAGGPGRRRRAASPAGAASAAAAAASLHDDFDV